MTLKKLYIADAGEHVADNGFLTETAEDKQKVSAVSEIKRGKALIVAGFVVSIMGIVAYCVAGFTAPSGQELSSIGKVGLALVATGTACWFMGAFKYFHGAIAADLPEELFF